MQIQSMASDVADANFSDAAQGKRDLAASIGWKA
jgi:hypothetical protein